MASPEGAHLLITPAPADNDGALACKNTDQAQSSLSNTYINKGQWSRASRFTLDWCDTLTDKWTDYMNSCLINCLISLFVDPKDCMIGQTD